MQLAYELENLRSLNVSGCAAITPDVLLVSIAHVCGESQRTPSCYGCISRRRLPA